MATMVKAKDLTRTFHVGGEAIHAVDGLNLNISANSLTLFQGPSGSGKTTLLNLLGALDYPTSGSVVLKDTDITKLSDNERDTLRREEIGFVFQSVALIGLMSAVENVDFRLRISGFPAEERQSRAEECLSLVNLRQRMTHRPHELSGGEQQRVAIARAISNRPSIIFADEPTGELDTHSGLQVVRIFRDLIEAEGITVIMTSHDPNMAELADRVIIMEDGKIVTIDGRSQE
jgi:putative ABC transport system ATP-binding protein